MKPCLVRQIDVVSVLVMFVVELMLMESQDSEGLSDYNDDGKAKNLLDANWLFPTLFFSD